MTRDLILDTSLRVADPLYWNISARSLFLACLTTGVCLAIGLPLAYVMARSSRQVQTILVLLVLIPFRTNFLIRTYAWMLILRAEGLFKTVLVELGVTNAPLEILFTDSAVFISLVYGYLPLMVLPLYVAMERMSPALEEAAADLYARGWMIFVRVAILLAKPGILAGCLLVFVPTVGAFIPPRRLGGGQSMMLGRSIQHELLVVRD